MTIQASQTAELRDVSKAMQGLHQHLLAFQADQTSFGESPLQVFERATKDAAFAWLLPLREAIVALDERRGGDEPMSDVETRAFRDQFQELLGATSGPFRTGLNAAVQSNPKAVWAIGAARKSLRALS